MRNSRTGRAIINPLKLCVSLSSAHSGLETEDSLIPQVLPIGDPELSVNFGLSQPMCVGKQAEETRQDTLMLPEMSFFTGVNATEPKTSSIQ